MKKGRSELNQKGKESKEISYSEEKERKTTLPWKEIS